MERERAALFEEATQIVRATEAQARTLTSEEDTRVLGLMAHVRSLEEQIGQAKRRHKARDQAQKRSDN
jgi:capsule polysaccharide export protein KpsE/RkpR